MPTVYVIHQSARKSERKLRELIFPLRTGPTSPASERWVWPELEAKKSSIQGFGLFPRNGGAVDWRRITTPILMPYLGMETEVESSLQAPSSWLPSCLHTWAGTLDLAICSSSLREI